MTLTAHTQSLLARLQELMMVSDDEVIQRGITQATTDRIIELRRRAARLASRYGTFKKLETQVIGAVDSFSGGSVSAWHAPVMRLL